MKSLAIDTVWSGISWKGSANKQAFHSNLENIHRIIIKISQSTFENEISVTFINEKIKTNLRHAKERVDRQKKEPTQ